MVCVGRTNTEKFYTVEAPSWDDCHHFHLAEERDLCRRQARREWVGHSGLFGAAVMPWRRLRERLSEGEELVKSICAWVNGDLVALHRTMQRRIIRGGRFQFGRHYLT